MSESIINSIELISETDGNSLKVAYYSDDPTKGGAINPDGSKISQIETN